MKENQMSLVFQSLKQSCRGFKLLFFPTGSIIFRRATDTLFLFDLDSFFTFLFEFFQFLLTQLLV